MSEDKEENEGAFARAKQLEKYAWKPGQSGNPAGKKKGARNKLTEDFLYTLYEDFKKNGQKALEKCREKDPGTYLKIIASLVPKHFVLERPLDGLSDEELAEIIFEIRDRVETAKKMKDVTPVVIEGVANEKT